MSQTEETKKGREGSCGLSRRNFIATASLVAAGGVLAGGAVADLAGAQAPAQAVAPPMPWPWVKLDPQEAGERAFNTYHEKGG